MQVEIYHIDHINKMKKLCSDFVQHLEKNTLTLLAGDLGTGKTTFVKLLASFLKIKSTIQSPTFNLLNQYDASLKDQSILLFHLDLYRLKGSDNLLDLDFVDLTHGKDFIAFIEWPGKVSTDWRTLNYRIIHVKLEIDYNNIMPDTEVDPGSLPRKIEITYP